MYHYDAATPDANLDAQHRIAKNLRFLRIAHTMSQEEVCKKIDISRSQYSCAVFLSGKRDKRSHIPAALCIIPVISHQLRVYDFI